MSSTASGQLKEDEPLDTRDFVPFEDDKELNFENIKEACERFYNAPAGSCDLFASERCPLCSNFEQVKGRKVFFIRFLEPKGNAYRTFRAPEASFQHQLLVPSPRQLHHYGLNLHQQSCPNQCRSHNFWEPEHWWSRWKLPPYNWNILM